MIPPADPRGHAPAASIPIAAVAVLLLARALPVHFEFHLNDLDIVSAATPAPSRAARAVLVCLRRHYRGVDDARHLGRPERPLLVNGTLVALWTLLDRSIGDGIRDSLVFGEPAVRWITSHYERVDRIGLMILLRRKR